MGDEKNDDDIIDVKKIKDSITSFFKKKDQTHHPEHTEHTPKSEDTISLDFQQLKAGLQRHARWIIPLLCILLAVGMSVYLRTMPQRLPIAENWAESAVSNFYIGQLQQQIDQQYPNLPQQNKEALAAGQWQEFQTENQELLQSQVSQLAAQYRNNFRDDQGTVYLLGIDPYYYYRQTEYVLNKGFPGTSIKEGKLWDDYRLAPLGREAEWNFHHWFGAQWHRFLNLFGDFSLMYTFFFVGTIFSALTVVPGFFIGRRITKNNVGGFMVAMLLAVSSFFVARTTGESSDTDVYSVFFSVLIAWLFIEAMETKEKKQRWCWAGLMGLATGLFAFAWTGWWYIGTFIIATVVFDFIYHAFLQWKTGRSQVFYFKELGQILGIYFLSGGIFIGIFTSFYQFIRILLGPFQFLRLKAVAVSTYWPNIRTTVAELNVPSFYNVLEQLGGKLALLIAIAAILTLLLQAFLPKREEEGKSTIYLAFLLAIWLATSLFATTKGVRFILQATPVFAIAIGSFLGLAWGFLSDWLSSELKLNKTVTKVILLALVLLFLIEPVKSGYSQAFNSVPSMNDEWYNVLDKIKKEAPENIIITSWWDFGHWFKAIANRPVTFDGGTQLGYGAYWVGRSLLTHDEKNAVGIVRMLNCGQNTAFELLNQLVNDTPGSIEILNRIVILDRESAAEILQTRGLTVDQTQAVLEYTHCARPPTDYYITSEDMVGKAGVWGHFGSWNFKKAVIHKETRNLGREQAVRYLAETFNYSEEEAARTHAEVLSNDADRWISTWPGYMSGWQSCSRISSEELSCAGTVSGSTFSLRINTDSWEAHLEGNPAVVPNSLVYAAKEGIQEKELSGQKAGFSVLLVPRGDTYDYLLADPLQAGSTFAKLFFMEGHGQKCFQKFDDVDQSGFRIITWIVDYSCQQENKAFFLLQEQVHASHILISTPGRSEEEALALIQSLQENVTQSNFADYAEKYSEDPGSRQQGGDLGWFKKGQMVPEFEQAAFALQPGQISEPVKTQFGYHLIYLIEKRNE